MDRHFIRELKKNGMLLKEIPSKERTLKQCLIAVRQNPRALQFVPSSLQTEKICKIAIDQDPSAFRYVRIKAQTPELCDYVISLDPTMIRYAQVSDKSDELFRKALRKSIEVLPYVPERIRNGCYDSANSQMRKDLLNYIKKDVRRSRFLPAGARSDIDILQFQKQCHCLFTGRKFYDNENSKFAVQLFCIPEYKGETEPSKLFHYETKATFNDFKSFYEFLNGNIEKANLLGADFSGINLHQFNITGAIIDANVLKDQGLYDDSFAKKIQKSLYESPTEENELALPENFYYPRPVEDDHVEGFDAGHITVFYISDIHLEWKIIKHLGEVYTQEEASLYAGELARDLVKSVGTIPFFSILLVGGDTSHNYELNRAFYTALSKEWIRIGRLMVVISGNHELWDPAVALSENIVQYRKLFKELGIIYLQNDLCCINWRSSFTLSQAQILNMPMKEFHDEVKKCPLLILGGVGFSGLNERYNAVNLLYGPSFVPGTAQAREKDIAKSEEFDLLYKKVKEAAYNSKVIVLTHMSKPDWDSDAYNPNWMYVNGHTHRNYFCVDENKRIYADNQIGYKKYSLGLKYFRTDNTYDIFQEYEDGIHQISLNDYKDFNAGKRISLTFNKEGGDVYMLKRAGVYMFFYHGLFSPSAKQKGWYFLNGGKLSNLNVYSKSDLKTYYNRLEEYVHNIHALLDRYTGAEKKLSEFIRNLGGSGRIHGSIIDVDSGGYYSYTHLYLNPLDGKVTPYFAYDTGARIVYRDLPALLERPECKALLDNYKKLESQEGWKPPEIIYNTDSGIFDEKGTALDSGTYIYKMSNVIKNLQYCIDKNVVRYWNEDLLNHNFINQTIHADSMETLVDNSLAHP